MSMKKKIVKKLISNRDLDRILRPFETYRATKFSFLYTSIGIDIIMNSDYQSFILKNQYLLDSS